MSADFDTRPVVLADLDLVCDHHRRMFAETGEHDAETLERMDEPFRAWASSHLQSGEFQGWVVEDGDEPVASLGLVFPDWPPHPLHPACDRRGHVFTLFVEPAYRRRGIGGGLMEQVAAEAGSRRVTYVVLQAPENVRPLLRDLHWRPTDHMARTLPSKN